MDELLSEVREGWGTASQALLQDHRIPFYSPGGLRQPVPLDPQNDDVLLEACASTA